MLDPTNADRADRAYRAVEAYAEGEYGFARTRVPYERDFATAAQDLMTDLMHLVTQRRDADESRSDHEIVNELIRSARSNYEAEDEEEK